MTIKKHATQSYKPTWQTLRHLPSAIQMLFQMNLTGYFQIDITLECMQCSGLIIEHKSDI